MSGRGRFALAGALALACTAAPPATPDPTFDDPPLASTASGPASTGESTSTTTAGADPTTTTGEPPATYVCEDAPGDPVEVSVGSEHVCARRGCAAQCWGLDRLRELGRGRPEDGICSSCDQGLYCCLGDNEAPSTWGDLEIGAPVRQIGAGESFTCALLEDGRVRCWGANAGGQLGLGHGVPTPPGSLPSERPDVKLGAPAVQLSVGRSHACAVMENGGVRCWGSGTVGQLGFGVPAIGDDELPEELGDIAVGGVAVQVSAGSGHTCALLEGGRVRCWGDNRYGQLGYGHVEAIGDDEAPTAAGDVPVGAPVVQVAAGTGHTCAVTESGGVRCWGVLAHGYPQGMELSCESCENDPLCCVGDDETPAEMGDLQLGAAAKQVAVGTGHTCALLVTGRVRCWGETRQGAIGSGTQLGGLCGYACQPTGQGCCAGDDEPPESLPLVDLGPDAAVQSLAAGPGVTCAVLEGGRIRCWGRRDNGILGDGVAPNYCSYECDAPECCVGDDETPALQVDVQAFSP